MNNLETVVRERNKAYYDLEIGECSERPGKLVTNLLGKLLKIIFIILSIKKKYYLFFILIINLYKFRNAIFLS